MTIEVMKQALEALESTHDVGCNKTDEAIASLRQAIEKAEKKEPKKWVEVECPLCGEMAVAHTHPVLTTPQPQREWVGLTDEEIALVCSECAASAHNWNDISFARAIEAKLKDKNT